MKNETFEARHKTYMGNRNGYSIFLNGRKILPHINALRPEEALEKAKILFARRDKMKNQNQINALYAALKLAKNDCKKFDDEIDKKYGCKKQALDGMTENELDERCALYDRVKNLEDEIIIVQGWYRDDIR